MIFREKESQKDLILTKSRKFPSFGLEVNKSMFLKGLAWTSFDRQKTSCPTHSMLLKSATRHCHSIWNVLVFWWKQFHIEIISVQFSLEKCWMNEFLTKCGFHIIQINADFIYKIIVKSESCSVFLVTGRFFLLNPNLINGNTDTQIIVFVVCTCFAHAPPVGWSKHVHCIIYIVFDILFLFHALIMIKYIRDGLSLNACVYVPRTYSKYSKVYLHD